MNHVLPTLSSMTAEDVMTRTVISVRPESSVRDVAKLLLDSRISAVPVVDEAGTPIGIVSEGDLLGRSARERLAGQEWWLSILTGAGQMEATVTEAAFVRQVRDLMHTPVVAVDARTPVREVAELLRSAAIKRVPVMRDGRMVGIVSRADLMRAVEAIPVPHPASGTFADMIGSMFSGSGAEDRRAAADAPPAGSAPATAMTAASFQHLVEASVQGVLDDHKKVAHEAVVRRQQEVKTMLQEHLDNEMWATLMKHAQVAAAHGEKELVLLRFPSDLCSDSGRKINNVQADWPETLRGESAEFYARWERDLKPAGFRLAARVIDYPQGMPGDIVLVLVWEN